MKNKYLQEPWHDKNLKITKYGLNGMRFLFITGVILGFSLGVLVSGT